MEIRDRITEFRRVPASELRPNPRNWRRHSQAQQNALSGILAEIGYAGAALAYKPADGGLMLIDGHLRAETDPTGLIPTLILDVTDDEAAKLLATIDPLSAMAEADGPALDELLHSITTDNDDVKSLLADLLTTAPIELGDPPTTVEENAAELAEIKRQRREANAGVVDKNDTEKYLVIVFASRAAKQEAVERLGLPSDERYVPASAVEIRARGKAPDVKADNGRKVKSAPRKKAGANG